MTNVIRKDSIAGIQENASVFVRKCMEMSRTSVDVYVASLIPISYCVYKG